MKNAATRGAKTSLLVTAFFLCVFAITPSFSQEVGGEVMRNCINSRYIRDTVIVDDLNILFFMWGKDVYHNILPRQCRGMTRSGRFIVKKTMSSICMNDLIGPYARDTCHLGSFFLVSREVAADIIEESIAPPEAEPLPMPEPQEVGAEKEESGG